MTDETDRNVPPEEQALPGKPDDLVLDVVLPDGRTGRVRLTLESPDRAWSRDWLLGKLPTVAKWVTVTLLGALVASLIGAHFTNRQRELELEGQLISDISEGGISAFIDAQDAHRVPRAGREAATGRAADNWVLASSTITPQLRHYYGAESEVYQHWTEFQSAVYDWIQVGGTPDPEERTQSVARIQEYLTTRIGEATREPPVAAPWTVLELDPTPSDELYQWVGYYLMRGRGAILEDLDADKPDVG